MSSAIICAALLFAATTVVARAARHVLMIPSMSSTRYVTGCILICATFEVFSRAIYYAKAIYGEVIGAPGEVMLTALGMLGFVVLLVFAWSVIKGKFMPWWLTALVSGVCVLGAFGSLFRVYRVWFPV